jgi:adenine C2-methylase RlmN of 23S rRNA A2503 and tRNA A37
LIPYNPTTVSIPFKASRPSDTLRFQKILKEKYGLRTIVRQEMGQDIVGACGQLSLNHPLEQKRHITVTDIEDIV